MAQGRRIAAVLSFTCLAALLIAAATAAALSLPSAGTTGATNALPAVPVPVPAVPTVTVPSTTTPKVSTPVATIPKTTVPKATTPSVSTPKVTTPAAPTANPKAGGGSGSSGSNPVATIPKTVTKVAGAVTGGGSSPAGGRPVSGVVGSTPGVPGSVTQPGSGTAVGTGQQYTQGSNGSLSPVTGPGPGGPGGPGGTGTTGGPGAISFGSFGGTFGLGTFAFTRDAGAMQLRAVLAPLLGCFYSISPFEQQVLTMRTGLDGQTPLTRAQLAGAFGISPAQVQRTETSAVRQLQGAGASDGCMSVVEGASGALAAFIAGPLGPLGSVDPVTGPATRPSPLGDAGIEEGVPSRSLGDALSSLDGHGSSDGPIWLVLLIAIMFSASAGALAREVRRSV